MFAATLKEVDKFLESITCNRCFLPNDNLQFVGTSCKHVFCWSCINEICYVRFPQCPLCAMPIGASQIAPANFLNQLFQLGLELKENIRKLDADKLRNGSLVELFEPDVEKRTFEEFCATQKEVEQHSESGANGENEKPGASTSESFTDLSSGRQVPFELPAYISPEAQEGSGKAAEENRTPTRRCGKRKSQCASAFDNDDNLALKPVPPDALLFSQWPTQGESLPQMTQDLPVFQEPDSLCFFRQRPLRTFADRNTSKTFSPRPQPKKRSGRRSGGLASPSIF